jgi:hypothetical protein
MKHYVDNTMTCADRISFVPTILTSADKNTFDSLDKMNP